MSRIPYPVESELSEGKRAYIANPDLRLLNVAKMAMHTPDPIWGAQRDFALSLVFGTTIEHRLREVVILIVGALSNCEYELYHHRSIASDLGFSKEKIEAIVAGDFSDLPDNERAIAQLTTELIRDVAPSDAAMEAALKHVTLQQVFEIVALIGSYMMTARLIGVAGLQVDDQAVQAWEHKAA